MLRLLALTALLAFGCASPGATPGATPDPEARVLTQADRAFAADVAVRGLDGWLHWFTPDAAKLGIEGDQFVRGHAAIAEADSPLFADPDQHLTWEPDRAGWLDPGRRGFTQGVWRFYRREADGTEVPLASGHYLTLWVATDAGWRVELDVGASDG